MEVNIYYVYAYLRENGTPYYIGKGKGDRMFSKNHPGISVPNDRAKIVVIRENLSEAAALTLEREEISRWGRKDTGTGILRNGNDGGFGGDMSKHIDYVKREEKRLKTITSEEYSDKLKESHQKRVETVTSKDFRENKLPEIVAKRAPKLKETFNNPEWKATKGLEKARKASMANTSDEYKAKWYATCTYCGFYGKNNVYFKRKHLEGKCKC